MTALPPLSDLRDRFSYDPITGLITHAGPQRGPRRPGQAAGSNSRGIPTIWAGGRHCRAAAVAWALTHGVDPWPQHVTPIDGDPTNLKLNNLQLSSEPFRNPGTNGRRSRRPAWQKKSIRYSREEGRWLAWHKRKLLGKFISKAEAINARRIALGLTNAEHS